MVQHKVVYIILAQLSFAFFFSCLLVTKLHNVVPRDWNATAWTDFSEKVSTEFDIATASRKLLLLLTIHTGHLYCFVPMLHVTKILYGYWFGLWTGWVLCVVWELWLVAVFLHFLARDPRCIFQLYVTKIRKHKMLFLQVSAVCFSGLPLQTKTLMVSFSDITNYEYFMSSAGATLILSLKNTACGALLAQHPSPKTVAILSGLVAFSLLLSALVTFLISSQTLFLVLKNEACHDVGEGMESGGVAAATGMPHQLSSIQEQNNLDEVEEMFDDDIHTPSLALKHLSPKLLTPLPLKTHRAPAGPHRGPAGPHSPTAAW